MLRTDPQRESRSLWYIGPLLCFFACILLASTLIAALPTEGEEAIYKKVVRLHVLANSDTAEDQAHKYLVRDAVLQYLQRDTVQASSAAEAEKAYCARLPHIQAVARKTLAEAGSSAPVTVTLTKEAYPPRTYEGYTLPAGTYTSLRICIGRAEGQNWWCVLFPPLCLSLAEKDGAVSARGRYSLAPDGDDLLLSAGFTPYEVALISDDGTNGAAAPLKKTKFKVRFKLVELLQSLFSD